MALTSVIIRSLLQNLLSSTQIQQRQSWFSSQVRSFLFSYGRLQVNTGELDNQKRAIRVQQLVDSCAEAQTDVKHQSDNFVKANGDIKSIVDSVLHKNGFASLDDLFNKAMEKMTPDERKKFEAVSAMSLATSTLYWHHNLNQLITSVKKFNDVSMPFSEGFVG